MQEHHFTVLAPFASVVDTLEGIDGLVVDERSDIHCLGTLAGRAGVIARPAYPGSVDVIVAEFADGKAAHQVAERLAQLIRTDVPAPMPLENA